ncbi:MAG TPA: hypothetical protein DEA58_05265 [Pseudothermotoga sp.]|nr:hypothetical protein [Pseudothermotoga sp.]
MKGYSIIELIISLFVIAIAALIFSLSINQAVA